MTTDTAFSTFYDLLRKELTDHWCGSATAFLLTEAVVNAMEDAGLHVVAVEPKGEDE